MSKIITIAPTLIFVNRGEDFVQLLVEPRVFGFPTARGPAFALRVMTDGTAVYGPDGAVVEAPVPGSLSLISLISGPGGIQAVIDGWDGANLLDNYY